MIGASLSVLDNLRRSRLTRTSTDRSELSPIRVRDNSISRSRATTRWALSMKAVSRSNSAPVRSITPPLRDSNSRRGNDTVKPSNSAMPVALHASILGSATAQDGADAGNQLARAERLGQIIVGAEL